MSRLTLVSVTDLSKIQMLTPAEVSKKGGILLANPQVPKFVYPTCLLGRQKSLGNLRKKKYYQNFEVDSPTVSGDSMKQRVTPLTESTTALYAVRVPVAGWR